MISQVMVGFCTWLLGCMELLWNSCYCSDKLPHVEFLTCVIHAPRLTFAWLIIPTKIQINLPDACRECCHYCTTFTIKNVFFIGSVFKQIFACGMKYESHTFSMHNDNFLRTMSAL